MTAATVHPFRRGSCRVLMMSTVVAAAAAGGVLAVGTQDARLLRLGLVAGGGAGLVAAFAGALWRREARSSADHADHLRSTYQLELEREVAARREHALTVERELREQAELTRRREIVELHAELAAMRANLEHLGGTPLVERVTLRAESTRLLPLPAPPRNADASPTSAQVLPVARSSTGTRFGPDFAPVWNSGVSSEGRSPARGRHGMPIQEWPESRVNRSSALPAQEGTPPAPARQAQGQRTVDDLIAAHGGIAPTARRRRNHA